MRLEERKSVAGMLLRPFVAYLHVVAEKFFSD